jgi:RecA-family ATPase/DNA-binding Lrp family transcriptional regulator
MNLALETSSLALKYASQGMRVIPIPLRHKAPTLKEWQKLNLGEKEIREYFSKPSNIGVLLGEPSSWLVDIDLDDPLAVKLAPYFLPSTEAVFGRDSKPCSHWLYICFGAKTTKWMDLDGQMLVELRSTGCQTVFPPSIHPSGETITWHKQGQPVQISRNGLEKACSRLASAVLLAKNWPSQGTRQDTALALAGGLIRLGFSEEEAENFIEAVTIGAGDEESRDRIKTVLYTARKAGSSPTTGWKRLSELIGNEVVEKVLQWLGAKKEEIRQEKTQFELKLWTAKELAETDFPEPTWLIPGILPEGGLVLLAGKPKVGKSWLALNMACELSNGGAVCGIPAEKAVKTLYLALEDTPRRLKTRIQQAGLTPNENTLITTTWPKLNEEGLAMLEEMIKQAGIQVVIVDTLAKVKPSSKSKVASLYDNDYEILGNLKELADRLEITVVVVHHLRKSASDDPIEEVSGTTGITGAVDTILVLKRARTEADGTLFITGRDCEEQELALRFNAGRWEVLGEAKLYEISKERREILEAIEELGGSAKPKEIAELLGKNHNTVKVFLRKLEAEGLVNSIGGSYCINPVYANSVNPVNSINSVNSVNPVNSINSVNPVNPVNSVNSINSVYGFTEHKPSVNPTNPLNDKAFGDSVYTVYGVYAEDHKPDEESNKVTQATGNTESNPQDWIESENEPPQEALALNTTNPEPWRDPYYKTTNDSRLWEELLRLAYTKYPKAFESLYVLRQAGARLIYGEQTGFRLEPIIGELFGSKEEYQAWRKTFLLPHKEAIKGLLTELENLYLSGKVSYIQGKIVSGEL